jgi:hypothetical protein
LHANWGRKWGTASGLPCGRSDIEVGQIWNRITTDEGV